MLRHFVVCTVYIATFCGLYGICCDILWFARHMLRHFVVCMVYVATFLRVVNIIEV